MFTQGKAERFWDYFRELPKDVVALHLENDDIFEVKKRLPNICMLGGMKNELLNNGTKEDCLNMAKRPIDEVGANGGFILSQDKLGSYRNDANRKILKQYMITCFHSF